MSLKNLTIVLLLTLTSTTNVFAYQCQAGGEEAEVLFEYAKKGYSQCKKVGDIESSTETMGMSIVKVVTTTIQEWECFNSRLSAIESFAITHSSDGWCDTTSVQLKEDSIFSTGYFHNLLR